MTLPDLFVSACTAAGDDVDRRVPGALAATLTTVLAGLGISVVPQHELTRDELERAHDALATLEVTLGTVAYGAAKGTA